MQTENPKQFKRLTVGTAVIGPAYLKLWHQGIRRLFNSCCLTLDVTPEELCVLIRNRVGAINSPDDLMSMREVLLGERDLELDEAQRIFDRYDGRTLVIDVLEELMREHTEANDG